MREPDPRWPDMESLLDALTATIVLRRRIRVGVLGLSVLGLVGAWPLLVTGPPPCEAVEAAV